MLFDAISLFIQRSNPSSLSGCYYQHVGEICFEQLANYEFGRGLVISVISVTLTSNVNFVAVEGI